MHNLSARAFISIELPQELRERISGFQSALQESEITKVGMDQLHITVAFLGHINFADIPKIKASLSTIKQDGFQASISGIACFPKNRPRVLYLNINKGTQNIKALYAILNQKLKAIDILLDNREFVPHLTVARVKSIRAEKYARQLIESSKSIDFGEFTCKEVKLRKSDLTSNGPIYTDLYTLELL